MSLFFNTDKKFQKSMSQKIFYFYFFILFFFLILFRYSSFINPPSNTFFINEYYPRYIKIPIYMQVLVINDKKLSRIKIMDQSWGSYFRIHWPTSIFQISNIQPVSGFENLTLVTTKPKNLTSSLQIYLLYFYDALESFVQTNLRWMIRTTEDCFVNIFKLNEFINDLEKHYNPLKDPIMKGQICNLFDVYYFIHGGSGWILSKAAAKKWINYKDEILKEFFKHDLCGDDFMTEFFMKKLNIHYSFFHSDYFLGTPLNNEELYIMKNNLYSKLPSCTIENNPMVNRKLRKMKNIIFWHVSNRDLTPMLKGYQIFSEMPNFVYFQLLENKSGLCIYNGKIKVF